MRYILQTAMALLVAAVLPSCSQAQEKVLEAHLSPQGNMLAMSILPDGKDRKIKVDSDISLDFVLLDLRSGRIEKINEVEVSPDQKSFAWSPNGLEITYVSGKINSLMHLYRYNVRTGRTALLSNSFCNAPLYGGKNLAFVNWGKKERELVLFGGEPNHRIATKLLLNKWKWTFDGSHICYLSKDGGLSIASWSLKTNRSSKLVLSDRYIPISNLIPAPNQNKIAIEFSGSLWIFSIEDHSLRELCKTPPRTSFAGLWLKDRIVLWEQLQNGEHRLLFVDPNTGQLRQGRVGPFLPRCFEATGNDSFIVLMGEREVWLLNTNGKKGKRLYPG